MAAIFKRELRAYFYTPIGYIYIAVIFFFSGYFFFTYNLFSATTDTSSMFGRLFTVVLFMAPVLTMRLLPDDRRLSIDRQLLSTPVSQGAVAAGKYFAAVIVYAAAISATLPETMIMSVYGRPDWPVVIGNYIGLLLTGCALIAVCLFLSAFTESQFIAAVCGFGVSLMLMLADAVSLRMGGGFVRDLMLALSFNNRYTPFTMGIFDAGGAVYFVSVAAFFTALAAAVLDRRRWG